MTECNDYTPQQRAAKIIWWILNGRRMTTAEMAERLGIDRTGTWKILSSLSGVFGLLQDEDGRWRLIDECIEDD